MAISYKKYIDITSSVGGANLIPATELITRVFSTNTLIPPSGQVVEFTSASAVSSYFGSAAEETAIANQYFSWVGKNFNSPEKISYSYWGSAATAPRIYGANLTYIGTTLTSLQAITAGTFDLTMGGVTNTLSGLDFSAVASFSDAATILQTAINAETGTMWTNALVSYDATANAFNLIGGDSSTPSTISTAVGSTAFTLGWQASSLVYPNAPLFINGIAQQTITEALTDSFGVSNNFGTFMFTDTAALTDAENQEAAQWCASQNVENMFLCPYTSVSSLPTLLENIGGTALTNETVSNEYHRLIPGMIAATLDYDNPNGSQNFMYQMNFNLTPSVTTYADAQILDALGVNYLGQTQTAGVYQNFYQDGVLTGASTSTNITDMNTYVNEMWLKKALTAALLQLLLQVTQLPANAQGQALAKLTMQDTINLALVNGVISTNAQLTSAQKAQITQITNNPDAWYEVQNNGYYLSTTITPYQDAGYTKYQLNYTLVYKKNDAIRKIVGTDILI